MISCGAPTCSRHGFICVLNYTAILGMRWADSLGSMEISPDISKYFLFLVITFYQITQFIHLRFVHPFLTDIIHGVGVFYHFLPEHIFFNVKIKSKILYANLTPEFKLCPVTNYLIVSFLPPFT